MYRDNTLIPSEAIRLLALGLLAEAPRGYAALARDVREFLHLAVGPSLDLVAPPLELLKIEGLVEASGAGAEATLTLSPNGKAELATLLNSNLRAPTTDISKLIIALKVRFLSQLPAERQELQLEMMLEVYERVAVRLMELKERTPPDNAAFLGWLDSEIAKAKHQRDWAKERLGRKA